ncbi:hypothetical protein CC80DRAFT_37833 [Byssothecium circinans]|uniref:Uncharacterized protein n=1 Tax=Byssothecium circinans TaxID=147558 RepID=A0A6A5U202_9PLEO|nr:hypothetical protein CC80DRAFT_37833 [Byssothecium circinans]
MSVPTHKPRRTTLNLQLTPQTSGKTRAPSPPKMPTSSTLHTVLIISLIYYGAFSRLTHGIYTSTIFAYQTVHASVPLFIAIGPNDLFVVDVQGDEDGRSAVVCEGRER